VSKPLPPTNDTLQFQPEDGKQRSLEAGRLGSWEAGKLGSWEAWRLGGLEAWRPGSWEAINPINSINSISFSPCAFFNHPATRDPQPVPRTPMGIVKVKLKPVASEGFMSK
jgi:hypothetical protein